MPERKRDLIWLLGILVVLIGLVSVLPMLMWWPWGGYMQGMMGMMGYGWGFMFLIPILFLVLIVLGAYYLFTEVSGQSRSESKGRALEILKERYANGDITREQYLKMKEDLEP